MALPAANGTTGHLFAGDAAAESKRPRVPRPEGWHFLAHARAKNGDRSIAAVFLNAGADINAREVEFHATALAAAVRSIPELPSPRRGRGAEGEGLAQRKRRMVEFLLKRGAATSLPDDAPWETHLACEKVVTSYRASSVP